MTASLPLQASTETPQAVEGTETAQKAPTDVQGETICLFNALVFAPWVGRVDTSDNLLHKISHDGIPVADWATAESCTAVCGAS